MPSPNRKPTRRAALAALGGAPLAASTAFGQQPAQFSPHEVQIPIRGKAGLGLEPMDPAMVKIMERHGIPGAALAIAKNGKLVLAKGYGWADTQTGVVVEPEKLFGLASLSKAITAVAVLKLVEQGKLGLDDRVFDHLKHIKPPQDAKVDPQLPTITVRQCLNHSGGWDRTKTGDPVCWEQQICRQLKVRPPLLQHTFVSYMMGVPLDFAPGTDAKYSNVGFIILGEVIAKLSGETYDRFVAENVLKPMGLKHVRVNTRNGQYPAGAAHRHLAGSLVPLPAMKMPMVDAAGGWMGSVVDIARFLTNLDGTRGEPVLGEKTRALMLEPPPAPLKPRADGTYFGLGWDSVVRNEKEFGYFKDGSYQGIRTFMKRLPNGVNWVLLFNASMDFDSADMEFASAAIRETRQLIEGVLNHPDIDLFKEFA